MPALIVPSACNLPVTLTLSPAANSDTVAFPRYFLTIFTSLVRWITARLPLIGKVPGKFFNLVGVIFSNATVISNGKVVPLIAVIFPRTVTARGSYVTAFLVTSVLSLLFSTAKTGITAEKERRVIRQEITIPFIFIFIINYGKYLIILPIN